MKLKERLSLLRTRLKLKKISPGKIKIYKHQILLFAVCRNEVERLPHFFKHYKMLGVDHFFIIDNNSDDRSRETILNEKDVHLFWTKESFNKSRFGSIWVRALMHKYAIDHWCFVVDIDEFFVFPHMEQITINSFCNYLTSKDENAVSSMLIDLYDNDSVKKESKQISKDSLLTNTCYFDSDGYDHQRGFLTGGPRARVFGMHPDLGKFSLVKYTRDIKILDGWHKIEGAKISKVKAALLHFKFISNFFEKSKVEAARKEHWREAEEYQSYVKYLEQNPSTNFYYSGSKKYENSNSLLQYDLISCPSNMLSEIVTIAKNL